MRLKSLLITFILSFPLFAHVNGQESNRFTNQQFLADFDCLTDTIINQVYAKQIVIDEVTRRNIFNEISALKQEVLVVKNLEEFLLIVQKALNLTGDAHSRITDGKEIPYLINWMPKEETEGLIKYVDLSKLDSAKLRFYQLLNYRASMAGSFHFFIFAKYFNSNYYNLVPFKVGKLRIDKGAKITDINDEDINEWVNRHLTEYSFQNYDRENKRYYVDYFFLGPSFYHQKDSLRLTFENVDGKRIKMIMDKSKRPDFVKNSWIIINLTKVKYFKKDKTLFIRLDRMAESKKHIKKIRKFNKKKNLDRVIVDIRGNGGGNDVIWKEIIEELIDLPLTINQDIALKNSNTIRNYYAYGKDANKTVFKGDTLIKTDSRMLETFIPSSTSIQFKKKIVLIQDNYIFSSAAAMSAIANYSDKFVTVGRAVDQPIGVGMTPMYFMLPNTSVLISIDPCLDITNAKEFSDVYNKVKEPVVETIDSQYKWITKNGNRWKRSFLIKNDPYYQKAIKVKID